MGKKAWRAVSWLILVEYTYMLYCTTVLYRPVSEAYNYDFMPFWSYSTLQSGREELLVENIMNVVVFVPIGVLGCVIGVSKWWKVILIGGIIFSSIELLQLLYKRGFTETDDVIHNVLGCMIGYGIYSLVRVGYEKISKRDMAVLSLCLCATAKTKRECLCMEEKNLIQKLERFLEDEARTCSMDFGCVTPLYVYRMWGGSVAIDEIENALTYLKANNYGYR